MQHIRIAKYRLTSGGFDEIADLAKGGMLPAFRELPGFVSYGVVDGGDGTLLSISHWETHAEAEAATAVARDWVATHLADRVELVENHTGDYAFLS